MKISIRSRTMMVALLMAFVMFPIFQAPASGGDAVLSVTYEFDFPEPFIDLSTPDRLYGIAGLELDGRGGVPSLPVSPLFLAAPPGHRIMDFEVLCSASSTIAFMESYPVNPAELTLNGERSFSHDYDGRPWETPGVHTLEGVEVLCLNLRPLFWNERTGALSFVGSFAVTLVYEERQKVFIGDLDRVRDLVDNPQIVSERPRSTASGKLSPGEYDHLIVTSRELSAPFLELAKWKGERNDLGSVHENIRSVVVTLEDVRENSEFWGDPRSHGTTGNDTQTIVRNFIIAAYQEWGVKYVLIGGDDDVIPTRMVKAPVNDADYRELPADIYYSGLDGDWDTDGDGVYGELFGIFNNDEADLLAEVFVGRATVSTERQAWNFVNKTIIYERGFSNQYADDILLIGEKLDDRPTYGDTHKEEVWNLVLSDEGLDRSTLYALDGTFSRDAVLAAMGSDIHVINHMGHGNFGHLADLNNGDVVGLVNDLPFIIYTQACNVAGFDEKLDQPGDCIAEEFVQGEGGAVAFIGNSRYGWYSPGSTAGSSQKFDLSFFSQVYDDDVTDLGRALSQSKEEWVASASAAGTMRWVYLELNLLGDPETRVHVQNRALHDLSVQELEIGRPVLGETCPVIVKVHNLGQSEDTGTLRLLVDGSEVASSPVLLSPGESATISLGWTPAEHAITQVTAMLVCTDDERPGNNGLTVHTMVDRRIGENETWTGNMTLAGGFLVDPLVTVNIVNCDVRLQPSALPYRISVQGALSLSESTVQGSPFVIESEGGELYLEGSRFIGMSTELASFISDGSLVMRDSEIVGGTGWLLERTPVVASNVSLIEPTGEWRISSSTAYLDLLRGQGGDGIILVNVTGEVVSSSWTGGSSGLSLERCEGMKLRDLSFLGNGKDLGIFGESQVHFEHEAENVSLTYGPLQLLRGLYGETIEGARGSLYLVGCQDILVRSSWFVGSGNGMAIVGSTNVEIAGNAFENCTNGILAIDSSLLAWGNDLLSNDRQLIAVRSDMTFGKEYPIGGNHWSDAGGADLMKGEGQDMPGSDGILDAAYESGYAYDRYPKADRCSLVHDLLEASFGWFPDQANRVETTRFDSASTSGIGIANWTWEMGDGALAYGEAVAYNYTTLGTFRVTLTVTDHYGRTDSAVHDVQVVNLDPSCDFRTSPDDPAPGETVEFLDLSMDLDGEIVAWMWEFGDGGTSDRPSPEHTFAVDGDYLVSLTVKDAEGGSGTRTRTLVVGNDPPIAAFTWTPVSVTTLVDVQFTSTGSDPDGQLTSWSWDFGDGSWGSGPAVKHRYSDLGAYLVTLVVTDDDGASASLSKTLTVINSRPVAAFEAPSSVESLQETQFVDRSYDLDGSVVGWSWRFGDGGSSGERSPSYLFQRPGVYTVELIVTDDRGWMGKTSSMVTVTNRLPEVEITAPEGDHWSLDVLEFSASGRDLDGMVVAYTWDMGDGTSLEGPNVSHAYLAPGDFTVTVTGRDDSGGEASASSVISIKNLVPRAEVLMDHGDHPLEVMFIAQGEDDDGELVSYNWSFGDGTFGTGAVTVHRYQMNGSYDVRLTVVDDAGGVAEALARATVSLADIYLSSADLKYHRDAGWTLSGEIVNGGSIPVHVILFVDAGGKLFQKEYNISGGSSASIDLTLVSFEEGDVSVKVITPDGWDMDPQDNEWTTNVEREESFPYWLVGIAMLTVMVAVIAMTVRKIK